MAADRETTIGHHLAEVRRLYCAEDEQLLATVRNLWDRYGDDADARLGECWRLAMIAATKTPALRGEAALWRARARSAFVRTGCCNGLALTLLPDFFSAVQLFGDDPSVAFGILDAMDATAGGDDDPVPRDQVIDTYYEKRGFLRTKIAAARDDRVGLQAAGADYDHALSFPTVDARRRLKIRAARTTVDYLLAQTDEDREAAVAALESVVAEAEAGGAAVDVVRIGKGNVARLRDGSRDLEPYEVL